jgi:hypothetical protein
MVRRPARPGGAPGRRSSPRPAWEAQRPSATAAELAARRHRRRVQLGPGCASNSSSSARWCAPGRQLSSPRPARPGGAPASDSSSSGRWRASDRSNSGQWRASDSSSSGRWRARVGQLQLGPVARAPGRQPWSPRPARPGGARVGPLQLGPMARVGLLQLGPVVCTSDSASSAPWRARRTAPARPGGARRTAPTRPVERARRRVAASLSPE